MKDFPIILGYGRNRKDGPPSIPWEMIAPHEAQALTNHGQTLKRLAERGGLSPHEAMLVLKGKKLDFHPDPGAPHRLIGEVLAWKSRPAAQLEAFDPCI